MPPNIVKKSCSNLQKSDRRYFHIIPSAIAQYAYFKWENIFMADKGRFLDNNIDPDSEWIESIKGRLNANRFKPSSKDIHKWHALPHPYYCSSPAFHLPLAVLALITTAKDWSAANKCGSSGWTAFQSAQLKRNYATGVSRTWPLLQFQPARRPFPRKKTLVQIQPLRCFFLIFDHPNQWAKASG